MAVCQSWYAVIRNMREIGTKIGVTRDHEFWKSGVYYRDHLSCSSLKQIDSRLQWNNDWHLQIVLVVSISALGQHEDERYPSLFSHLLKSCSKRISALTLILNAPHYSSEYRERIDKILSETAFQALPNLCKLTIPDTFNDDMSVFMPLVAKIQTSSYQTLREVCIPDGIYIKLFYNISTTDSWRKLKRIRVSSSKTRIAYSDWDEDNNRIHWPNIPTLENFQVERLILPFHLGNPDNNCNTCAMKELSIYLVTQDVLRHGIFHSISHLRFFSFNRDDFSEFQARSVTMSGLQVLQMLDADERLAIIHAPTLQILIIKACKVGLGENRGFLKRLFKDGPKAFSPKQLSISLYDSPRCLTTITDLSQLESLHIFHRESLMSRSREYLVSMMCSKDNRTPWSGLRQLVICGIFFTNEIKRIVTTRKNVGQFPELRIISCGCMEMCEWSLSDMHDYCPGELERLNAERRE